VKSITVYRASTVFVYQKDDKGQWTCPGRVNAQTEAFGVLSQLAALTINDFPDKRSISGLSSPSYTVELGLSTGSTRLYQFGKRANSLVYLAVDKGKDIYQVSDSMISQMEGYYNTVLTPVAVTSPGSTPQK
jgi:hypothetical protein